VDGSKGVPIALFCRKFTYVITYHSQLPCSIGNRSGELRTIVTLREQHVRAAFLRLVGRKHKPRARNDRWHANKAWHLPLRKAIKHHGSRPPDPHRSCDPRVRCLNIINCLYQDSRQSYPEVAEITAMEGSANGTYVFPTFHQSATHGAHLTAVGNQNLK
jgi:hypothetical protein